MELNEEEVIGEAFKLFDLNNDGQISFDEIRILCGKIGALPSEQKALLRFADKDRSGTIGKVEFISVWRFLKKYGEGSEEEDIAKEFKALDQDGSGFITKHEMLETITKCQHLTGEAELEAQKCLDEIDLDEDGKVSFPEFLLVWKFR